MKPFWTTPKKIAFTIALAVLAWWLMGCQSSVYSTGRVLIEPAIPGAISESFLYSAFSAYNEQYFQGKLEKPKIIVTFLNDGNMAETGCNYDDGTDCTISFDKRTVPVERTGQSTLLHEMCHMKTWKYSLEENQPPLIDYQRYAHGREWRSCMLSLDAMGAFREIEIDYYKER